jgi:hypothetical protein
MTQNLGGEISSHITGQWISSGTNIGFIATANPPFSFSNWLINSKGTTLNTSLNLQITSPVSISAGFKIVATSVKDVTPTPSSSVPNSTDHTIHSSTPSNGSTTTINNSNILFYSALAAGVGVFVAVLATLTVSSRRASIAECEK